MSDLVAAFTGLCAVLAAATILWAVSVTKRDASIADIWWGPAFILLAWLYPALLGTLKSRPILIGMLVTTWGVRLAAHLQRRHRGQAEDPRYRSMRDAHGDAFWWRSLFIVFWLQAALVWFIALPVLVAARTGLPDRITVTDVAGLLLFGVGFAVEAIGDHQLQRFKAVASNRGTVLDTGLWHYTRHPNYFGDAVVWWGVYAISASTPAGWLTCLSPIAMTFLLLRVSGVTLLEKSLKARPGYKTYVERTSPFVPWFPRDST